MKKSIREKDIALLWESRSLPVMEADSGVRVQVLYPGRDSVRKGCDFQDAILIIDDKKVHGDVEIHVSSDLWHSHGHHRDPSYNTIILHVAMWEGGGLPATAQNGAVIPTVILGRYLSQHTCNPVSRKKMRQTCGYISSGYNERVIHQTLQRAGVERFQQKVNKFKLELCRGDPEQVLYSHIARALGYARNTVPFERTAQKLPLGGIRELLQEDVLTLRACLFGVAGLLPSQRSGNASFFTDEEIDTLERRWSARTDMLRQLQSSEWCFHGIRPGNHPSRRLAALSILLQRYFYSGLSEGLLELLGCGSPVRAGLQIENGLIIEAGGYWGRHYDFGVCSDICSALLGRGKAAEIAVNVVLPYFASLALENRDISLICRVIDIYSEYHSLSENEITRYMRSMLSLDQPGRLSACRQQGLLHLYHKYCRLKDCSRCPMAIIPKRVRV
ncbi:MAG: DUF2851 family protein [Dehalococcoidia bacterium]|nr:DUF2851 family protein [Dehalococcoidia bacterium]MDD5494019.1 DUF2851 family protein [Dehalococcoidia bacterium]